MTTYITVTRTERAAARLKIKRAPRTGQVISAATRAIANAKPTESGDRLVAEVIAPGDGVSTEESRD
jgi:hypothetical protein